MTSNDLERYKLCIQCLQSSKIDYRKTRYQHLHDKYMDDVTAAIQKAIDRDQPWTNMFLITPVEPSPYNLENDCDPQELCAMCEYVLEHVVLSEKPVRVVNES